MDSSLLLNLLQPAVLFFLLGALATLAGSDLEIPTPIPRILSLYLLAAIGMKGAHALHRAPLDATAFMAIGAGLAFAVVVPLAAFAILRRRMDMPSAAATAAAYGSVSAVTFITAAAFLDRLGIGYSGHMVAVLALMESPAIIVGLVLARRASSGTASAPHVPWRTIAHDAVLGGPVFLLLGSLVVGLVAPQQALSALDPFFIGLFPGILAIFLLDMGLLSARRFKDVLRGGPALVAFGVHFPFLMGLAGVGAARLLGFDHGDVVLFAVLCGSASYIAVPVVMRVALPDASPGLYVGLPLGVTFPFNVALGIPAYHALARVLGG